ncbi:ATP-grasp ribosomal peptide maturase [Spiractinospora alimapuensis]|uniref:ATP-grasp ribosomal peptide maturase n=1 Tax=Spiractinospora alimapuensis TaxID=2820884 RepID=UPI001F2348E9|nr:ATP-grasp ribosomal peptide maturase [Spiractinospora alimapuensis]QVQ54440.1 ATP-grasp ribosomal peptide maturase [Spiractinospora alimapuensis]
MTVLILTRDFDPTSDHVIEALNRRRAPVLRCDVADFPLKLEFTATLAESWAGALRTQERVLDLSEVTGIYYRRPTRFRFPSGMSDSHRAWAEVEARLGFLGTLAALPRWLNHPSRIANAEYKPLQLRVARELGLRVPETIVTNVASDAKAFATGLGRPVIYKPFSPRGVIDEDGRQHLLFATPVTAEQIDDPALHLTTHMIQEYVAHTHAVRLCVVDTDMFAAEIHSGSIAGHLDWRKDYAALKYSRTTPPAHIRATVQSFMSHFDLRFGAFDFLVDESGRWVFLEINPNGQWAWIPEVAPMIASALATALQEGRPRE